MARNLVNSTKGNITDHTGLFVITITDIYIAKSRLMDYLPLMIKKATNQQLKSKLLDLAVSISVQLLRLNFILATLKYTLLAHSPLIHEMSELDDYLSRELKGISNYSADVLLLVHLSLVESKEIDGFQLLKKLASRLNNKWKVQILDKNLQDAIKSKEGLDGLFNLLVML